jgi:hypothetical protein
MTKHLFTTCLILVAISLSSCLSNDTDLSTNPKPSGVSIKTNTLAPGIESTVFSIDETNLLITNTDSIAFDSRIDKLVPVFSFKEGAHSIVINGIVWNSTDSIDFSSPLTVEFIAKDKKTTITYTFAINKHKVDPEAITWNKQSDSFTDISGIEEISGMWMYSQAIIFAQKANETSVFKSSNGETWSNATTNIPLQVSTVLGHKNTILAISNDHQLIESTDGTTWQMVPNENGITFSNTLSSLKGKAWIVGYKNNTPYLFSYETENNTLTEVTTISSELAYKDAAKVMMKTKTGIDKAALISGAKENNTHSYTVYSSISGDYWVNTLTQSSDFTFGAIKNTTAIWLDRTLLLIGGEDETTALVSNVYSSVNEGYTWKIAPSNKQLPTEIGKRKNIVGFVDSIQTIWLIGGTDEQDNLKLDVWKGRLNKLDFLKQQ